VSNFLDRLPIMLFASSVLSVALAAQLAVGTPIKARTAYAVKESHFVPRGWTLAGTPAPTHTIHLSIAVKQGQFDELERHLYEGN
jgi:tripeptidyl-peptidase-1